MQKTYQCLSVRQPDAWLIVIGEKTVENRSRRASHRGKLLIHSSANRQGYQQFRKNHENVALHDSWFAFGAIIGSIDLVDVVEMSVALEGNPYAWGPYCYMLEKSFWFQQPIPCPGKVTLFKLPSGLVSAVNAQLAKPPRKLTGADAILKAIRPTEVDVLWGRANEFIESGSLADAAEFLDALATKTPDDAEVFGVRAQIRWGLGDFRGALADFDEALRLDDSDAEVLLQKAEFLAELGFLDRALACCQPVASKGKKEKQLAAGAFFLMGKIALNRENYEAALDNFSRAIALDPEDPEKHARRGFLYFVLERKKEAEQDFANATRLRVEAESAETEPDEDERGG